jgi:Na+-driven multidrug efflux pump
MWVVGVPTGLYLVYIARPTFGLVGLWAGLITGMSLLAIVMIFQFLFLDWREEAKRKQNAV